MVFVCGPQASHSFVRSFLLSLPISFRSGLLVANIHKHMYVCCCTHKHNAPHTHANRYTYCVLQQRRRRRIYIAIAHKQWKQKNTQKITAKNVPVGEGAKSVAKRKSWQILFLCFFLFVFFLSSSSHFVCAFLLNFLKQATAIIALHFSSLSWVKSSQMGDLAMMAAARMMIRHWGLFAQRYFRYWLR